MCVMRSSIRHAKAPGARHTTYSYVRTHVRSIGTKTHSQQPIRLVTAKKINGKGRAWHNSILSHCKIFGTRDGGTRRRAGDVSGPSNSQRSRIHTLRFRPAINTIFRFTVWAVINTSCNHITAQGTPEATSRVAESQLRVGCHGLVDRFRISTSLSDLRPSKLWNLHCNCYPTHSEVGYLVHERYYSFINENI